MKRTILASFGLFFISILTTHAQCNVLSERLDDGARFFLHEKERIYINKDLEAGVVVAYIQLILIQSADSDSMYQFAMWVDCGKLGMKELLIPRKIELVYADGSVDYVTAESIESPRQENSFIMQKGTFRLNANIFGNLRTKPLSDIHVVDHRTHNFIMSSPYADILLEQANCLVKYLNK
jgi:hypothetical protein